MEATLLNPVQLHLLRMFTYNRDEASLFELKDVLFNHYYLHVYDGVSEKSIMQQIIVER